MVEIQNDELGFRFPEVHGDAFCRINFQRTLRIPDDNRQYPLPPGLARFPLQRVDDDESRIPETWSRHGGVFLPMYQSEAMWLHFSGQYPMALKIAAGKIDTITGEAWTDELSNSPQNYVTIPAQPWLDGFSIGKGLIRQFVAMPLGEGYTAEEQLTGKAEHGGLQIVVYPMHRAKYEEIKQKQERMESFACYAVSAPPRDEMGLAPGGLMQQKIYEDDHGLAAWDTSTRRRCFVHVLNSTQYHAVTGAPPPTRPPTAQQYTDAGLPWFEYYDADRKALEGSEKLRGLDSVAAKTVKDGRGPLPNNDPMTPKTVKTLHGGVPVREGEF